MRSYSAENSIFRVTYDGTLYDERRFSAIGGQDEHLRRDAAAVETGATEGVLLDEGDLVGDSNQETAVVLAVALPPLGPLHQHQGKDAAVVPSHRREACPYRVQQLLDGTLRLAFFDETGHGQVRKSRCGY